MVDHRIKVTCSVILLTAATFVSMLVYAASKNDKGWREIATSSGLFHLRQPWGNSSRNGDAAAAAASANSTLPTASSSSSVSAAGASAITNTAFTNAEIAAMRQRLSPRELIQGADGKLLPHQFLHLHHMKTGGTSMDGLIQCGMQRLLDDELSTPDHGRRPPLQIPYTNLHECSQGYYAACRSGQDPSCLARVQEAAILSYCAPVSDLSTFHWRTIDDSSNNQSSLQHHHQDTTSSSISAVTVLRHPVQRVWSMYRFRTKSCYQCRTLKEVYENIDNGQEDYETDMCASQIMNHQTRNLVSSSSSFVNETSTAAQQDELNQQQQHVQEAISNFKQFFTMVGLTEDMVATAQIVGHAFPWLAERRGNASDVTTTCPMPRKNTSPSNNGCGPNDGHLALPDHPDDETARLIEAHNQLDLQVYEAAVQHFALQKVALGLD